MPTKKKTAKKAVKKPEKSFEKTRNAIPRINCKQIKVQTPVIPKDKKSAVFSEFESFVTPLFNRTDTLASETLTLTKLRDTLLPKLISGELEISGDNQFITETLT